MRKKWFGLTVVVAMLFIITAPGAWAADNGPETLDINAQEKFPDLITKKDKKSLKGFKHKKHQEEYLKGNSEYVKFKYTDDNTCVGCHHKTEKGATPTACLKCKDVDKMLEKVAPGKGAKKFENVYHNNCRDDCHAAMEEAGKKTGPAKKKWREEKKCAGCHPKK